MCSDGRNFVDASHMPAHTNSPTQKSTNLKFAGFCFRATSDADKIHSHRFAFAGRRTYQWNPTVRSGSAALDRRGKHHGRHLCPYFAPPGQGTNTRDHCQPASLRLLFEESFPFVPPVLRTPYSVVTDDGVLRTSTHIRLPANLLSRARRQDAANALCCLLQ